MARDESKMLREFPFNHLALPDDETVLFTRSNPTFHRDNLQAVLISNKALYLGGAWQDRVVKWRRFPLTEIKCATLISGDYSVASLATPVLIKLLVPALLFFASFKAGMTELGWNLFFFGVLVLWLIASGVWDIIRGQVLAPCALRIEVGKKNYTWHMPGDTYVNEIDCDCLMLQSTLDKLDELGVRTATHRSA